MRLLWILWYRLFPPRPPEGKGTRDNPLVMDDIMPLIRALRRTEVQASPSAASSPEKTASGSTASPRRRKAGESSR
jgi:hypothetical protein